MGLGSGAGLEIEVGSGLDGFEEEEGGGDDEDDDDDEEEEGEEEGEEGVVEYEVEEEEGGGKNGIFYFRESEDGSFYQENEEEEEVLRLAGLGIYYQEDKGEEGIGLGAYYQEGEGEEGMVRLDGMFEGLPLDVGNDEEGDVLGGVLTTEEVVDMSTDDVFMKRGIYEKIDGLNDDGDNDFMVMSAQRPGPGPIEISNQPGQTGQLSSTTKKPLSEQSKPPRPSLPPVPPAPPVPAIGPLFVRDGDAEWLVVTTDNVLSDPLLRKYLPAHRRPFSFRLPLPLPFHTPR